MKKTKDLIQCAVFAAILCVFSVIAIPIGPVPVSLGLFGVLLCAIVLGKKSILAILIYILLGAFGLPVFSGFSGGAGVLVGLTGGYIFGYIPAALFVSAFLNRLTFKNPLRQMIAVTVLCLGGVLLCDLFGTVWFMYLSQKSFFESVFICVVPFLFFDFCKCILAAFLGLSIKKRLTQSRVHRS